MDPNTQALIMGAAGASGAEKIYVEDVFSTWLYTGNNSTQTITNGIDLSGKGGLVWCKARSQTYIHELVDTARGAGKALNSGNNIGQTVSTDITGFTSSGFTLGYVSGSVNSVNVTNVSWTLRKAAKFFDVVTYTGNGVAGRTVAHNLGSTPGCIVVKNTTTTGTYWCVYHRSLGATKRLYLNTTTVAATGAGDWASTEPTSSVFSVGFQAEVNTNGDTYVAYLFAHDAGGFGDSGNESVIKCGSYTADASGNATVELGWEPQWILYRNPNTSANWDIEDTMRGAAVTTFGALKLLANSSGAEGSASRGMQPTPTGFKIEGGAGIANATYIYIAIRRGPMKTPTDATKVFDTVARSVSSPNLFSTALSYVDLIIDQGRSGQPALAQTRLAGDGYLRTTAINAEQATGVNPFDYNGKVYPVSWGGTGTSEIYWMFRRAPSFFDVVAYTGTGATQRDLNHSLGSVPELIIYKSRSASSTWGVLCRTITPQVGELELNATTSFGNSGFTAISPYFATSSTFRVGSSWLSKGSGFNSNGTTYIAYLFASCPGVSKVDSYTGTGTTLQVNCGFTSGARFVLIKRTDSTGDWYVWDTARGIVSGNDPYLLLNSTVAEVTNTDYIDPLSSGFQISSSPTAAINANGGTFIYLAIA